MNKSIKIQFVTGDMMLYIAAYNNVIKSMWVYRVALIFRKKGKRHYVLPSIFCINHTKHGIVLIYKLIQLISRILKVTLP